MQGLLAFLMGGFISYNGINIERQQNKNAIFIPSGLYLIWCAVNCFYPEFQLPFLNMLRLTLGAYSVWTLYDLFSAKKNWLDKIISWAPYTFFIYVFHEPWINIYKRQLHSSFLPWNFFICLATSQRLSSSSWQVSSSPAYYRKIQEPHILF